MIDRIKVRLFLGIFFSCFFSALLAQNGNLIAGDSLFNQQKYTEAYDEYEMLFKNEQASSAMLLRMAFIQDGLGNYTEALFFMDKYYQQSADRLAIGKIEELAETNDLDGYRYDDIDYFLALLSKFRLHLTFLLTAISILLLVYIIKKNKEEERPLAAGIIPLAVLGCLFAVMNIDTSERAIILSDYTLLRSGPSAGAEPIELVSKGHKVKIIDQDQVWTQIEWDGREVYVRNGKLRII